MHKIDLSDIRSGLRRLFMMVPAVALLISTPVGASLIITVGNVFSNSPSSSNTARHRPDQHGARIHLARWLLVRDRCDGPAHHVHLGQHRRQSRRTSSPATRCFGPINQHLSTRPNTRWRRIFGAGSGARTIAAGATVGLGHVLFDISAGDSSGLMTVMLSPFSATSLSDPARR